MLHQIKIKINNIKICIYLKNNNNNKKMIIFLKSLIISYNIKLYNNIKTTNTTYIYNIILSDKKEKNKNKKHKTIHINL